MDHRAAAIVAVLASLIPSASLAEDPPLREPTVRSDDDLTRAMGQPFYSGEIIPAPKQATYREEELALYDGTKGLVLCQPEFGYEGPARELIIRLLSKRLEAYRAAFPGRAWDHDRTTTPTPVLFASTSNERAKSLLARLGLEQQVQDLAPQGYVLEIRPERILCLGEDNQGMANALASLIQLMHVKDGKLVVRGASIVDWPTFRHRSPMPFDLPSTAMSTWMSTRTPARSWSL